MTIIFLTKLPMFSKAHCFYNFINKSVRKNNTQKKCMYQVHITISSTIKRTNLNYSSTEITIVL